MGAGGWRYSVALRKHFWTKLVLPGGMLGCVVVVGSPALLPSLCGRLMHCLVALPCVWVRHWRVPLVLAVP